MAVVDLFRCSFLRIMELVLTALTSSFFYFRYSLGEDGEKDQLMLWQDVTNT